MGKAGDLPDSLLERDPIGERSLYYAQLGDRLVHAPSLRELLQSHPIPRELDLTSVATYLAWGYLPGRETLVRGVFKVLPGERVEWRDGRIEREFYWSLPPEPSSFADEDTLRMRLREALEAAVRRACPRGSRWVRRSPWNRSSLVVALAARLHDAPVHTYSVSFGAGYPNELEFSSLVSRHCNTRHHVVEVTVDAVLRDLDRTIALLGDPIGDPLTVPNALLFAAAAADTGVMLNGEGGDPCFGGRRMCRWCSPRSSATSTPARCAATAPRATCARTRSATTTSARCSRPKRSPESRGALEDWIAPSLEDSRWRSYLARLMAINVRCKGAHHILSKVEALSQPFGVQARSPLFDREVVELAFATPPQLKLRGTVEKYLLKEAVRDLLPEAILERPKSGMLVPVQVGFAARCYRSRASACSTDSPRGAFSAAAGSSNCWTAGCPDPSAARREDLASDYARSLAARRAEARVGSSLTSFSSHVSATRSLRPKLSCGAFFTRTKPALSYRRRARAARSASRATACGSPPRGRSECTHR
jgi:asparagine synthase (glutamine-hydrolysing)